LGKRVNTAQYYTECLLERIKECKSIRANADKIKVYADVSRTETKTKSQPKYS
jgi:hypothetical protein